MRKDAKKPDRVKESRVVYRVLHTVKDRKAMQEAARRMDEIQRRHANDPAEKDVVTLLREERER
jgi:hypothetical protein